MRSRPLNLFHDHLLPAGHAMAGYRFMFNELEDLGTPAAPEEDHLEEMHEDHMKHEVTTPSGTHSHSMKMQMHMLDIMYGLSDSVTVMAMVPLHEMAMTHNLPDNRHTTRSNGLGDVEISSLFRLSDPERPQIILGTGLSLPTGDIDGTDTYHDVERKHPYHLKLGSGTYDFLPSLSITADSGDWSYGGRVNAALRFGTNGEGYRLGNRYEATAWTGLALSSIAAVTTRITGKTLENVRGSEDGQSISSPLFDPYEQSSKILEAAVGLSLNGSGCLTNHRLGLEVAIPLAQSTSDGIHEERWSLAGGWSYHW